MIDLKKIAYIWLCILSISTVNAQNKKMNVLFIAVDDLNVDMNVFDDPLVKTPNLDRLLKIGVRFDRAYCQYPLCSPSRTSLMTGLRPDQTQVKDLVTFFRNNLPEVETLPQMFMKNSYKTARVGKIYHYGVPKEIGTNGQDDSLSWNKRINPIGIDRQQEDKITNYTPSRGLGSSLSFWAAPGTDDEHTDGKAANEAVKLLEEFKKAKEQFFLAVGFYRPHTPYIAPKKYFDLYPLDKIQLAETRKDDWDNKPAIARFVVDDNYGLSESQRKEVIQAYYASISFMDAQVGKLLDKIEEAGFSDNTIIVFWSDHGYALGLHGQWQKMQLFENVARVPMIISVPGLGKGKITKSSAELIDIYPTLAELTGLTPPKNIQGKSLVEVLNQPDLAIEAPSYTQVDKKVKTGEGKDKNLESNYLGRSVRYHQWRYTEWNGGKDGAELYNYDNDPKEFNNLINNSDYHKIISMLKEQLHKVYK